MNESINWQEEKYQEVYEQEVRGLERRRSHDPTCTVQDVKGILTHLYNMDGSDWVGRGALQDVVMQATIAAYEHVIAQWEKEERLAQVAKENR
jgi:phage-related protein